MRYKDAAASPAMRRHAYGVLVFFLMPGMMSLFSIVGDADTWWRVVFGITGLMGLLEIALYYSAASGTMTAPAKALRAVGMLDYVAILIVCADPKLPLKLNLEG